MEEQNQQQPTPQPENPKKKMNILGIIWFVLIVVIIYVVLWVIFGWCEYIHAIPKSIRHCGAFSDFFDGKTIPGWVLLLSSVILTTIGALIIRAIKHRK